MHGPKSEHMEMLGNAGFIGFVKLKIIAALLKNVVEKMLMNTKF